MIFSDRGRRLKLYVQGFAAAAALAPSELAAVYVRLALDVCLKQIGDEFTLENWQELTRAAWERRKE